MDRNQESWLTVNPNRGRKGYHRVATQQKELRDVAATEEAAAGLMRGLTDAKRGLHRTVESAAKTTCPL